MTALLSHFPWPASEQFHILDLACGTGHRGLTALTRGHQVSFIDKDLSRLLPEITDHPNARCQCIDLEDGQSHLAKNQFDAVWVFNYLHRPLYEQIAKAIKPGGILVYETFTWQQAQIGRPRNPDFLLQPNELPRQFYQWEILFEKEGLITSPCLAATLTVPTAGISQYKAQFIARKPIKP
ncbi:type 12 methyltransferase [Shewanella sp. NFH-SH190041]|uniref:class I SAM-dependent methyltransferase n=1 Tax=Shewanella sp. NFH-SH190041 TaxID=2950245 RepID=UPI0021C497C8|nr:class I SAM-dependent methyltransferase [Shewanella sp. NFH-SH190041]BDM63302.1 type 12 methyltransferase [Shewanella sp. NFH-SH190041]